MNGLLPPWRQLMQAAVQIAEHLPLLKRQLFELPQPLFQTPPLFGG